MSGKCKKRFNKDRQENDNKYIDLIYNFESISSNSSGNIWGDLSFVFEFFAEVLFVYCCQYFLSIYWLAKTHLDGIIFSANDTNGIVNGHYRRQRTRRGSQLLGGDASRQQRQHQQSTNVNIRPAADIVQQQQQPGLLPLPICFVSYHFYLQTLKQFAHLVCKHRLPLK